MKLRTFIFIFCLTGLQLFAQFRKPMYPRNVFGHKIRFDLEPTIFDESSNKGDLGCYVADDAVEQVFSIKKTSFEGGLKSSMLLGVKLDPKLSNYNMAAINSFSKSYAAFRISDGSDAVVIALGITRSNVANYHYRVIVNDSVEVIHWSPIKLAQLYGAKQPYGFIGKFTYQDKQVLVEVINVNDYSDRDGVIFDWRKSFKPFITNLLISAPPLSVADSIRKLRASPEYDNDHDPVTHMVSNLSFAQGAIGKTTLFVKRHDGIPYEVSLVKKEDGKVTEIATPDEDKAKQTFSFDFYNIPAGKYAVIIHALDSWNKRIEGQEASLDISISHPPITERKIPVKQILLYVSGGLIIIGLLFWLYRRNTNIKLVSSAQAKQNTALKLRSIRAQLNPHFMFNALTSIQNLVNKKDMEGANHYLSRFADLTRKVLNTGDRDLISLEDEVKILDDYLQMEQLRFNFQYDIKIDNEINKANTEVPAMLLQPFVENAVKHGVANLRERGVVKVEMSKVDSDLLLIINDNGSGFQKKTQETANNSFGLKLSEERIQLLNEVYKDQPAKLTVRSNTGGTTVTITLSNWIS